MKEKSRSIYSNQKKKKSDQIDQIIVILVRFKSNENNILQLTIPLFSILFNYYQLFDWLIL